jgi:hypothetical protein
MAQKKVYNNRVHCQWKESCLTPVQFPDCFAGTYHKTHPWHISFLDACSPVLRMEEYGDTRAEIDEVSNKLRHRWCRMQCGVREQRRRTPFHSVVDKRLSRTGPSGCLRGHCFNHITKNKNRFAYRFTRKELNLINKRKDLKF